MNDETIKGRNNPRRVSFGQSHLVIIQLPVFTADPSQEAKTSKEWKRLRSDVDEGSVSAVPTV